MKPLTTEQLKTELAQLDGWSFDDDKLHKDFRFTDFKSALAFMVRVGFEAEEQGHHPEWTNIYNTVSISLSTHDAGGKVTQKDIRLAKTIDKITYDT